MILSKETAVKIGAANIKHYKSLGYDIKFFDIINVPISHIPEKARTKIKVKCDVCSCEKELEFIDYNKNFKKYNLYTCSSKCSIVKSNLTNEKNFGVKRPGQNKDIYKKIKKTKFDKYGNEVYTNADKSKQTNISKYEFENVFQNESIKIKINKKIFNKYGVEYISQSEDIKNKKKNTTLKNHGFEYPMQSVIVRNKNNKNSFKLKEYTYPSGEIILIQGYENKAIDELLKSYNENDIITKDSEIEKCVGQIWYVGIDDKKHRYFPDIFIKSINKIIEVKSPYTYNKSIKINKLKETASLELNFKFQFMVFNNKGTLLKESEI